MPALRPLPARPSLEYERKDARSLLRSLRAARPEAIARARTYLPPDRRSPGAGYRLSDAQLILAREYGFASWPRLVRYFGDVARQGRTIDGGERSRDWVHDDLVRSLLVELGDRRSWAARSVAAFVPRFYGQPLEAVFTAGVTLDEARLAVARQLGASSWAVLLERAAEAPPGASGPPWRAIHRALQAGHLDSLRQIAAEHPSLLDPASRDGVGLLRAAFWTEREQGRDATGPIIAWLVDHGADVHVELNRELCGNRRTTPETVRWLLDQGADPDWIAPNGVSVLEHALVRYWNGAAVDVLAARASRPGRFWIAAALGDVAGTRGYFGRDSRLLAGARVGRPPFDLAGTPPLPLHPDPSDDERLMEVFVAAMINGRAEVMRLLATSGFDVNTTIWDTPVLNLAVRNRWVWAVETLLACGADPDIVGWRPNQSACDIARELASETPNDAAVARIVELLGAAG